MKKGLFSIVFLFVSLLSISQKTYSLGDSGLSFKSEENLREYVVDDPTFFGFDNCKYAIEIEELEIPPQGMFDLKFTLSKLIENLDLKFISFAGELKYFPFSSVVAKTNDGWGYEDSCNNLESYPVVASVLALPEKNKYYKITIDIYQISEKEALEIINTLQLK